MNSSTFHSPENKTKRLKRPASRRDSWAEQRSRVSSWGGQRGYTERNHNSSDLRWPLSEGPMSAFRAAPTRMTFLFSHNEAPITRLLRDSVSGKRRRNINYYVNEMWNVSEQISEREPIQQNHLTEPSNRKNILTYIYMYVNIYVYIYMLRLTV